MKTKIIFFAMMALGLTTMAQQGLNFFKIETEPQGPVLATPIMTIEERDAAINNQALSVVFVIQLADISSAKLHLKLGSDSTAWNKYDQVLNLDGTALPNGTTILRNGIDVRILIGNLTGLAHYNAQVEVESAAGIKSTKFQIIH